MQTEITKLDADGTDRDSHRIRSTPLRAKDARDDHAGDKPDSEQQDPVGKRDGYIANKTRARHTTNVLGAASPKRECNCVFYRLRFLPHAMYSFHHRPKFRRYHTS